MYLDRLDQDTQHPAGPAGETEPTMKKVNRTLSQLTPEAMADLDQLCKPERNQTTLTKKEIAENAARFDAAMDADKVYTAKHTTRYLEGGSEGYSGAIIGLVYSALRKCAYRWNEYPTHNELLEMSIDRLTRFAVMPYKLSLAGRDRKESTKTKACSICDKCRRRRALGKQLSRTVCTDIITVKTPARKAFAQPTTLDQWRHALLIECTRRDYVKKRGYLASDDAVTHSNWEEVYRHAPKAHTLRPLTQMTSIFLRLDDASSTIVGAALDGLIDELDETIILIKASARKRGSAGRQNHKSAATPLKLSSELVYKILANKDIEKGAVFGFDVDQGEINDRIKRIERIANLKDGQKLPKEIKPYPVAHSCYANAATAGTTSTSPQAPPAVINPDHWIKWAAANMATAEKALERITTDRRALAKARSSRADEYGRTPAERLDAARTRKEKRQPLATDRKTDQVLAKAKAHNEHVRKVNSWNAQYAGLTQN